MNNVDNNFFNSLFKEDVFFIQIGANDGVSVDPINSLIRNNNWKGILFEPGKEAFEQLKINYNNSPNLIFVNAAVSNYDGKGKLYCGSTTTHFTLYEQIANNHFSVKPVAIEIDVMSPTSIIEKYNVTKIDLLQIDAEGHDFEILKAFPFDKIKPRVIRFEFTLLFFEQYDEYTSKGFLESLGYQVFINRTEGDMIAVLKDSLPC